MLSEEGGRFFREQNRNLIVFAKDEIPVELPPNFIWMTLNQLFTFIKFNNYLNIQARSLISSISFV
jgi:oxidase EvaA